MTAEPSHSFSATPVVSSLQPPRPNSVSRFTPPSSPTRRAPPLTTNSTGNASRKVVFPVPRRTPIPLPRPKLPSPRTSPGGTTGKFKLPTPAKKLPIPRLGATRLNAPHAPGFQSDQPRHFQPIDHTKYPTLHVPQSIIESERKGQQASLSSPDHTSAHGVYNGDSSIPSKTNFQNVDAYDEFEKSLSHIPDSKISQLPFVSESINHPKVDPSRVERNLVSDHHVKSHDELQEQSFPSQRQSNAAPSQVASLPFKSECNSPHAHLTQPSSDAELPKEWTEMTDTASGRNNFMNSSTSKTSSEIPAGSNVASSPGDACLGPAAEDTGTLQTFIETNLPPSLPSLPVVPVAEFKIQMDMEESSKDRISLRGPTTGATSNSNQKTVETTHWRVCGQISDEFVDEVGESQAQGSTLKREIEGKNDLQVNDFARGNDQTMQMEYWTETMDPISGSHYFYNPTTGETSWTNPLAEMTSHSSREFNPNFMCSSDSLGRFKQGESTEDCCNSGEPQNKEEIYSNEGESTSLCDGISYELDFAHQALSIAPPSERALVETSVFRSAPTSGDGSFNGSCNSDVPLEDDNVSNFIISEVDETQFEKEIVEKPFEAEGPSKSISESECWTQLNDPMTGKLYYYNRFTNETTWDKPYSGEPMLEGPTTKDEGFELEVFSSSHSKGDKSEPETEIAKTEKRAPPPLFQVLAGGWSSGVDPSNGRTFFFNAETGETSWEAPNLSLLRGGSEQLETKGVLAFQDAEATPEVTTDIKFHAEPETETTVAPSSFSGLEGQVDPASTNVNQETYIPFKMLSQVQAEVPEPLSSVSSVQVALPEGSNAVKIHSVGEIPASNVLGGHLTHQNAMPPTSIAMRDQGTGVSFCNNAETHEASWDCPTSDCKEGGISNLVDPKLHHEDAVFQDNFDVLMFHADLNKPFISTAQPVTESGGGDFVDGTDAGETTTFEVVQPENPTGFTQNPVKASENPEVELESCAARKATENVDTGANLPDGWIELFDPASGLPYYFNEETNATSWDPPLVDSGSMYENPNTLDSPTIQTENNEILPVESPVSEVEANECSACPHDGFVGLTDSGLKKVNAPESTENVSSGGIAVNAADNPGGEALESKASLPNGWIEVFDAASGLPYYFNKETSESSWELPIVEHGPIDENLETLDTDVVAKVNGEIIPDELAVSEGDIDEARESVDHFRHPGSYSDSELHQETEHISPERMVDDEVLVTARETDEDRTSETNVDLPDGWIEVIDPASGLPYYYNEATNETTWDAPLCSVRVEDNKSTESDSPVAAIDDREVSPEECHVSEKETCMDDDNLIEPESVAFTEPPLNSEHVAELLQPSDGILEDVDAQLTPVVSVDPSDIPRGETEVRGTSKSKVKLPADWIEVIDSSSGLPYYYNEITNETSWEVPFVEPVIADPSLHRNVLEHATDSFGDDEGDHIRFGANEFSSLPLGWVLLVDPSSGKHYYFNSALNLTSWEIPVANMRYELSSKDKADADTSDPPVEHLYVEEPCAEAVKESVVVHDSVEIEILDSGHLPDSNEVKTQLPLDYSEYPLTDNLGASTSENALQTEMNNSRSTEGTDHQLLETGPRVSHEGYLKTEKSVADNKLFCITKGIGDTPLEKCDESLLPIGWMKLSDDASGKHYYYNEIDGTTSWDFPVSAQNPNLSTVVFSQATENLKPELGNCVELTLSSEGLVATDHASDSWGNSKESNDPTEWKTTHDIVKSTTQALHKQQKRSSPSRALASFGFGGRLCVFRSTPSRSLWIYTVKDLIPSHPIMEAELKKRNFGLTGPLNGADSALVSSYVRFFAEQANKSDILWNLILIASRSEGRLRSDEGVADAQSPESSILQLLMEAEVSHDVSDILDTPVAVDSVSCHRTGLYTIESLLLHGKREEAVAEAIRGRQFAMALLIASMCDRSTFQHATKQFADHVASRNSPLYTLALLFSGQLEPPPDSALEVSGLCSTLWSDCSDSLRHSWKQHLCAIISNRMHGWDRIVLTLGDRLLELGDVHAAHCCYMVCGCPISSIIHQSSRMSLVGCDHLVPLDAALVTDAGIRSFYRSEAYEWAKRRGNPDVTIASLQSFKLTYAMFLTDLGCCDEAELYVQSIRESMAVIEDYSGENVSGMIAPTVWALSDPNVLSRFINELETRLRFRKTTHQFLGRQGEDKEIFSSSPDVAIPDSAKDSHDKFHLPKSNLVARSSRPGTSVAVASTQAILEQSSISKSSPDAATPLMEDTPMLSITPNSSPPSVPGNSNESLHSSTTSGHFTNAKAPKDGSPILPSIHSKPPSVSTPLAEPTVSSEGNEFTEVLSGNSTADTPAATRPGSKIGETLAPIPARKESSELLVTKPNKKVLKAPISAPAQLQRTKPSPTKEPSSAQKRAWGLDVIRPFMTKWLNPEATTADLGGGMEAYYDKDKKVWVFPGDNPAELAKPLGPPPTVTKLMEEKHQGSSGDPSDPLAAMMAPPPRNLSSLRRQPGALAVGPPIGLMPPPGLAIPKTPAAGPPTFMMFTPTIDPAKNKKNESFDER